MVSSGLLNESQYVWRALHCLTWVVRQSTASLSDDPAFRRHGNHIRQMDSSRYEKLDFQDMLSRASGPEL